MPAAPVLEVANEPVVHEHEVPPFKPLMRGWLHVVAFVTVVVMGSTLVIDAIGTDHGPITVLIYVLGTAAMFGVSSAYHRLRWTTSRRALMSKLDHSTIFLAIAGAYTPMAIIALNGWHQTSVLLTVWIGALVGITLQWVPFGLPRWAFAAVYVVVGWAALPSITQWYTGLRPLGFFLVIAGGLAYTVGAVIYAVKRPDPWPRIFGFHEVFHSFTIVGAGLHMAVMLAVVMPRL